MDKLSTEQWESMSEEEQQEVRTNAIETVPDAAISVAEQWAIDNPGKTVPSEKNIIAEAKRKITKELEEKHKEELDAKEEELASLREKNTAPATSDYWEKRSEDLLEQGIDKSPTQLRQEAEDTARIVLDMQRMGKQRVRDINRQIRELSAEDLKLYGKEIIQDEIEEMYSENSVLPKDAAKRALIFVKGKNVDNILADAKSAMEKKVKGNARKIEGEDVDDVGTIPGGGSGQASSGNKQGTPRQRRLADMRNISVDEQIRLDVNAEKRKKSREK